MPNYYKLLLRHKNGDLTSYMTPFLDPRLVVTYRPNEWVESPIGGLFVFTQLARAIAEIKALKDKSRHSIFLCECSEEVPIPPLTEFPSFISFDWAQSFWLKRPEPQPFRAFKRLKLIKEVINGSSV